MNQLRLLVFVCIYILSIGKAFAFDLDDRTTFLCDGHINYIPTDSLLQIIDSAQVVGQRLHCQLKDNFPLLDSLERIQVLDHLRNRGVKFHKTGDFKSYIAAFKIYTEFARTISDQYKEARGFYKLAVGYYKIGDIAKSFEHINQSYEISENLGDFEGLYLALERMAWNNKMIGNCEAAMEHILKAKEHLSQIPDKYDFNFYLSYAEFLDCSGKIDQARLMADSAYFSATSDRRRSMALTNKVLYFKDNVNVEERIQTVDRAIEINYLLNDSLHLADNLGFKGKLYGQLGQYTKAEELILQALAISKKMKVTSLLEEQYRYLEQVYQKSGNSEKAYETLHMWKKIEDQIRGEDQLNQIYENERKLQKEKDQAILASLEKEKEIKELQLSKANLQKQLILLFFGLILVFAALFWYQYRSKKKQQNELLKQRLEQEVQAEELKALRAQMNPHFIFNSLNSIKSYIAKKEPRVATSYLNKFSKLIRLILTNSNEKAITIRKEIEALTLYIEVEKLRFEDNFTFEIDCAVELMDHLIPPLILQPYVENAIWHGLLKKKGERKLNIAFTDLQDHIKISVRDNGVGRTSLKKAMPGKPESLGMKITEDRLSLSNRNDSKKQVIVLDHQKEDGSAAGVEVQIRLEKKLPALDDIKMA